MSFHNMSILQFGLVITTAVFWSLIIAAKDVLEEVAFVFLKYVKWCHLVRNPIAFEIVLLF